MKKVLILVLSANFPPYYKMRRTSERTWNSIKVEDVETVFYFGNPLPLPQEEGCLYLNIDEGYNNLGKKTLMAFEWALKNKEFDYIARVNSSTYVDKKELLNYVKGFPDDKVFAGLKVIATPPWMWGPAFIISKDKVRNLVGLKNHLDASLMEDMGISFLMNSLNCPYIQGKLVSIDKLSTGWQAICYGGGESFNFTDWEDIKKTKGQFFFRVKCDADRNIDEFVMNQLFKHLK